MIINYHENDVWLGFAWFLACFCKVQFYLEGLLFGWMDLLEVRIQCLMKFEGKREECPRRITRGCMV